MENTSLFMVLHIEEQGFHFQHEAEMPGQGLHHVDTVFGEDLLFVHSLTQNMGDHRVSTAGTTSQAKSGPAEKPVNPISSDPVKVPQDTQGPAF